MKILFFGEIPGEISHGISVSNKVLLEDLPEDFQVFSVLDNRTSQIRQGASFDKALEFLRAWFQISFLSLTERPDYFYAAPSISPLGAAKGMVVFLSAKVFTPSTHLLAHIHRGDLAEKCCGSVIMRVCFWVIFHLCDSVIHISKSEVKKFNETKYLGVDKFKYVPNTITLAPCSEGRSQKLDAFGYLSNYLESKGIHDLLTVWSASSDFPMLITMGSDSSNLTRQDLQAEFKKENITISGGTTNDAEKRDFFSKIGCLILPSWNEGAPLVVLEAMSQGVPVICSDVGYLREMLGEDYRYFYPVRDNAALTTLIAKFNNISDNEYCKLSTKLIARFRTCYSRNVRSEGVSEIFFNLEANF